MSDPLSNIVEITKPNLVIFLVVDCSGSMADEGKMNSVNVAIKEALPILKGIGGSDSTVKLAVLKFSIGAEWLYSNLLNIEDFVWENVEPYGYTEFGAACDALYEKMSRSAFMNSQAGYRKPVIILLSDGEPTDDYANSLKRLKSNAWYKVAYKIAIAVGDEDKSALSEFTGAPGNEGVFVVQDVTKLGDVLKATIITSSQIGKNSRPVDFDVMGGTPSPDMEKADQEAEKEMWDTVGKVIEEAENPDVSVTDFVEEWVD